MILLDVKKILEYLRECKVFYLATVSGMTPRVRPMSGVCVAEGKLWFFMRKTSELYREIKVNPRVEISALHPDKSWISIRGRLSESGDVDMVRTMWKACRDDIRDLYGITEEEMAVFSLEDGSVQLKDRIEGSVKRTTC